jgi:hypothetical protein
MRIKQFFAALFIFYACIGVAQANSPESGWWWNASESGRGYSIEIQDDKVYFAAYSYDSNKQPVWYYSSGTMTGDSYYSGRVVKAVNGACFGCTEGVPQSIDVGSMSISFNGGKDATLNILGFITQITRFDFANGDNTHYPNACYGEWAATIGNASFPVYFGERIRFNEAYTSGTTNYLLGNRAGSSGATDVALCGYTPSTKTWLIILDSSTNYYKAFSFKFTGFNRMEGTTWTYLKSETISGSGLNFVAFRTASKSSVQGLGGPRTEKSIIFNPASNQKIANLRLDQDKSMADSVSRSGPVLPETQNALSNLQRAISTLQK